MASDILEAEVGKRRFPMFSLTALGAVALIGLPWTLVWPSYAVRHGKAGPGHAEGGLPVRFLLVWLILTILPFLFIRTFERYLLGSMVPLSLLCAGSLSHLGERWFTVGARMGAVAGGLLGLLFSGVALWFGTGWMAGTIGLGTALWYGLVWWRANRAVHMVLVAAVLWATILGYVYPTYGVNAVPKEIIDLLRDKPVVLYGDPQPALLPVILGRGLWRTRDLGNVPETYGPACNPLFVTLAEFEQGLFLKNARQNAYNAEIVIRYWVLIPHGSWLKFGRRNARTRDWLEAFRQRSLTPVMTEIMVYSIRRASCVTP